MKLITKCPHCESKLRVKAFLVGDRLDLAKAKGKVFEMRCSNCQNRLNVDVDDVIADSDYTVPIVSGLSLIGAVVVILFFWDVGIFAFFTLSLPIIVASSAHQNQRVKIRLFNDLYYDSKRLRIP